MLTKETRRPDCRYYESCVKKRKIVERTRDRRLARDEEKKIKKRPREKRAHTHTTKTGVAVARGARTRPTVTEPARCVRVTGDVEGSTAWWRRESDREPMRERESERSEKREKKKRWTKNATNRVTDLGTTEIFRTRTAARRRDLVSGPLPPSPPPQPPPPPPPPLWPPDTVARVCVFFPSSNTPPFDDDDDYDDDYGDDGAVGARGALPPRVRPPVTAALRAAGVFIPQNACGVRLPARARARAVGILIDRTAVAAAAAMVVVVLAMTVVEAARARGVLRCTHATTTAARCSILPPRRAPGGGLRPTRRLKNAPRPVELRRGKKSPRPKDGPDARPVVFRRHRRARRRSRGRIYTPYAGVFR